VLLYVISWRHGASSSMQAFWADGFPPPGGSYFGFLGGQLMAMWKGAFQTHALMPRQASLPAAVLLLSLIVLAARGTLLRRPSGDYLLFCAALLAVLCLLNLLRIWPLGASRQNLFLFGYAIAFLFLWISRLAWIERAAKYLLIVAGIGLAGLVFYSLSADHYRRMVDRLSANEGPPIERSDLVVEDFSHGGVVGKVIEAACRDEKTAIVADGYMASALPYYIGFDPTHRQAAALLAGNCVRLMSYAGEAYLNPEKVAADLGPILAGTKSAWFVYTHYDEPEIAALRQVAGRFGQVTQSKTYPGAGYFLLVTAPAPGTNPPAGAP
jgi:hypothetical protein